MTRSTRSLYAPARSALLPVGSFMALGVFWGAWAALVPQIQRQTGASDPELGAALLWIGGGALPAMLATGRLWARFGRRLVGVALLAYAAVALLPGLAHSPLELSLSLALIGAASGWLDVAMNSAVGDLEASSGRRLMFGAHALFSAALLFGSISAGLLRAVGLGAAPILALTSIFFVLVAGLGWLARGRAPYDRHSGVDVAAARSGSATGLPPAATVRTLVFFLGLLCAVAFLIEDALSSWSALLLEREFAAGPALAAAGPGLFAGAMAAGRALGQVVGRWLTDRQLVVASGVVTAIGIALTAFAPSVLVALAGLVTAGAGVSLTAPALFARAARLGGAAARGAAISTLTVLGYMGFVIGPPIIGFVAGAAGLRTSFALLAVGALVALSLGGALALRARPPSHTPLDPALPPVGRA